MKLYTEEQVRGLVMALCDYNILKEEVAMQELTPIELPSDEEIEKELFFGDMIDGAIWMKQKILNQKK